MEYYGSMINSLIGAKLVVDGSSTFELRRGSILDLRVNFKVFEPNQMWFVIFSENDLLTMSDKTDDFVISE